METDILEDLLTPEEKLLLSEIEKKISNKIKEIEKNKYDHLDNDDPLDLTHKHPDIVSPTHITDCPHEIKITVISEISSIDDRGYLKDVKEVFRKNYHIPVITGQDYTKYADKFFETFEKKLTSTCQEMINPKQND